MPKRNRQKQALTRLQRRVDWLTQKVGQDSKGETTPAVGGGGGGSDWDDLTGELSGPVPFDATDDDGNPTSRSLQFLNVTPEVDVTSDPANGIALEIKNRTNGNRLGTLTTDGRWETRGDMEAFADGSFGSGPSTNSLLQVEDAGTVLTTDAASLTFKGSGVSLTKSGDEITIDVSGGSTVGSLSDLSDVSSAAQGDGNVLVSDGASYSEESVQSLFDAHVSDVDADTLDGVEGGNYARTDQNETFNNDVYVSGGSIGIGTTSSRELLDIRDGGGLAGTPVIELNKRTYFGYNGNTRRAVVQGKSGKGIEFNVDSSTFGESTAAVITNAGNGGFGGETAPSYAVEVAGDVRSTGEQEAFLGSDRRLKANLNPLGSALDKIDRLTGYGFDWREGDAVQPHKRGRADVGLIAQEVENVLPEAVKTFTDGHSEGYKSVSYDKLVPLLVEAIKDLRFQINQLR